MRFSSFVKKTAISVLGFMFVMSSVTGCRIQYVEDETTQDDTLNIVRLSMNQPIRMSMLI